MAKSLGLGELLGPARNERSIAYGLILSRAVHPLPKLATTKWWGGTTLASDLGLEDAGTGEARAAMGWLVECQVTIETSLAPGTWARRRTLLASPASTTPSWVEGTHNGLAAPGYSRDKKRGMAQIAYGLLTDAGGRRVAIGA